ncbi:MAG: hypothetical protein ACTSRC_14075 [Candidatus Helarchaeota archaeon]
MTLGYLQAILLIIALAIPIIYLIQRTVVILSNSGQLTRYAEDPSAIAYGIGITIIAMGIGMLLALFGLSVDTLIEAGILIGLTVINILIANFFAASENFISQLLAYGYQAIIATTLFYAVAGAIFQHILKVSWGWAPFVFYGTILYSIMLIIWGIIFVSTCLNY